jgi:hypothetical protein
MTLIKDLIDIPERVHGGDYVLNLSEGVYRPEDTLREYVVTPELKGCFDNALSFIRSALQDRTSKASYLHGSFGSGKSHFMAVLHLILQGNAAARSIPELAPVITRHNEWISGKKFLLVPYHMLGARDMESGILGGYVDFIRRTHPEAPIPGVYLAEGLFRDAENLRRTIGDEAFFAELNEGVEPGGGWGDLEASWDASRFENAVSLPPGDDERSQLISALIRRFFGSYDTQAGGQGEAFVSLDKGLSVLSRHAANLGYQGLILFLDELILWLAGHAVDLKFVHQEGQKLAKLVEAQTPDRPIPIISFVARQRDLRDFIGDSVPGADRLNFSDALKHWEDRFHRITLEDRNLPAIAEKRVLKVKSESARKELDAAFEQTRSIRDSVMNILLTHDGDREMFRKVYPFSPALVQTLIAVSSVLQRERTALRMMMQLLVDHRETLRVGDIVPAGDLFDAIAHGDEAFSPEMARHFENARRLYHQKLLPLLERQHGRRDEIESLPADDPKRLAFRNDDRLIKTLLLAALVPEVESLRSLNGERLAALNHGTIRTPIPGKEGQEVVRRCRQWAAEVGEIRIGEEQQNPSLSIQLSGVDTEGIIQQASREDNHGNRIRRVRQMIFEQVKIEGEGQFEHYYEFAWKNTRRTCVVLFKNVRELTDSSIENTVDDWKLIIDFPFDEQGHGPRDDLSRIQSFKDGHPGGTKTICWVPAFFSREALKELGRLVILEHILTGERFGQYANHLSPQDRQAAKQILDSQRSVLHERVKSHLDAAYGLEALVQGSLDTTHDLEMNERFVSLWPGFDPRPPVAASLAGAMNALVSQALDHEFPAAPAFEAEPRGSNLKKVYEVVGEAARTADGRVAVEKGPLRALVRGIANPLRLGEMALDATHFVLGHSWRTHFTRKAAETGAAMEVAQLRRWIDEPRPMGLSKEVENLIILTFAQQTNRSFFLHGGPYEPSLNDLPDACELREQRLPPEDQWNRAIQRAAAIFGVSVSPLRNASNVAAFSAKVKEKAAGARQACQAYCQRLKERVETFGIPAADSSRLSTALATLMLLERIHQGAEEAVVGVLDAAEIASSEAAMGECLAKAGNLQGIIDSTNWEVFDAIEKLSGDKMARAEEIRSAIAEALRRDEHAAALGATLKGAQSRALHLLTTEVQPEPQPPKTDAITRSMPHQSPVRPGRRVVDEGSNVYATVEEAQRKLDEVGRLASNGRMLSLTILWRVEEEKGSR